MNRQFSVQYSTAAVEPHPDAHFTLVVTVYSGTKQASAPAANIGRTPCNISPRVFQSHEPPSSVAAVRHTVIRLYNWDVSQNTIYGHY